MVLVLAFYLLAQFATRPAGAARDQAPAAARSVTDRPALAIGLSVAIAIGTVWAAIAASYQTNWPVGFFVGVFSAGCYALGRTAAAWRRTRRAAAVPAAGEHGRLAATVRM